MLDITDFNVTVWLQKEMRGMLEEEIARACLVGDGRSVSSNDKINAQNIRPIWTDAELYTIAAQVSLPATATEDQKAKEFIRRCIKARKSYKGSGNPTLYTTDDMLTDCLLLTDSTGRDIYESIEKLATKLRVKEIVTVPVMENLTRTVDSKVRTLLGIMVNPVDYNIGTDRGCSMTMFNNFAINYNAEKYLMEIRCSCALTVTYSAIVLASVVSGVYLVLISRMKMLWSQD